eukprot:4977224-Amphidinium_carterae.2
MMLACACVNSTAFDRSFYPEAGLSSIPPSGSGVNFGTRLLRDGNAAMKASPHCGGLHSMQSTQHSPTKVRNCWRPNASNKPG